MGLPFGAPPGPPRWKFKNCTAMHTVYKGGVKRPGAMQKGGKLKYKPFVEPGALQREQVLATASKDGIACER